MKTKIVLSAILAIAVASISLRCTIPTQTSGNGSDIGNATVAGMLYLPDGKTPAAGVKVAIRPKKTLADTGSMIRLHKDTATVTTNTNGRFAFDSTLDTGTYVIEAASGNDAVLIDSVVIKNITTTDTLPPDTLKPAGAIKGIIYLSEGGDPRKVFVLAFGIDRFARIEADGRFRFQNLAEARYDLRIISSLDDYGVLDTAGVPVLSADTTNLDTVELPFIGIPTPKNVKISYDTMKQIVTLMWSKADTALVKGYNVYRRNVDSNTVLARINTTPITDTVYRDSTGVQDQTYEYRVAAVDKNATEGTKSAAVSIKVVSAFQFVMAFGSAGNSDGQFNEPGEMAVDSSGNIYILDPFNTQGKIHKYSSTGVFIKTWVAGAFDELRDIEIAKDTLYVLDRKNKRVKIFNTIGDSLRTWTFSPASDPMNFSIKNSSAFIVDRQNNRILKYALTGDSISTLTNINGNSFKALKSITIDPNTGNLMVLDADSLGYVADSSGNLISQFRIEQKAAINASSQWFLLKSGNLIYTGVEKHTVFVIDITGKLIAQFGEFGSANGQFKWPVSVIESSNKIFISDAQNSRVQVFNE